MEIPGKECWYDPDSENDSNDSDDSQEDPTFNVLEDTRFNFSNLSLKSKTKARIVKVTDERNEQESDMTDEQDQKSYETIQKIIEGGHVEKLKVEQCKVYLRKHGLRLSGNKETLIRRIKEHLDIVNGSVEEKYPPSSFVLNCKGDACTGDVVIFEQNVYEVFSIASRSANGPPLGTRIVAGRIVKESYGAAKQQHTFTIEVLWSKGEKPLTPLHQLLIKGRNLYRLKTMRQKWGDEGERARMLSEKHARGDVARLNRESRIQNKEMRKLQKKPMREKTRKQDEEGKADILHSSVAMRPEKLINQPKQKQQYCEEKMLPCYNNGTSVLQIPNQPEYLHRKPNNMINSHIPPERVHQRQPLVNGNCSFPGVGPHTSSQFSNFDSSKSLTGGSFHVDQHMDRNIPTSPIRGYSQRYFRNSNINPMVVPLQRHTLKENERSNSMRSPLRGFGHNNNYYVQHGRQYNNRSIYPQVVDEQKKKICMYYPQGRCHFGTRCKYLHE